MRALSIFLALLVLLFGCGDPRDGFGDKKQPPTEAPEPGLDASLGDSGPVVEASPGAEVSFEPPATPSGVAPIARIRFRLPEDASPHGAILVSGTLSTTQLRDISRGTISKTVDERRVEALIWGDPSDPQTVIAAPLEALVPGETYTLALASPSGSTSFVVAHPELPTLRRLWPMPKDAASAPNFAIFCAEEPLSPLTAREMHAQPGDIAGVIRSGIGAQGLDVKSCLRWDSSAPIGATEALVLPPTLELDDGSLVALDPSPLAGNGSAPSLEPVPCPADELPLGPSCIDVDDDRLVVRPSYWSALWAVGAGDALALQVALEGRRFLLRPLPTASEITVRAAAIDAAGRVIEAESDIVTAAPRAHVVINEVMAAPKGPEPAQEWVELVNDGLEPADLADFQLDVAGSATPLPSLALPPGAFAIVVSEAYVLAEGSDVPPASGTRLVRIPKLGKRGLSNEGQVISLLDAEGSVVSRFPATPKPQKGVSVGRVRPDALDELSSSFAYDPNGSSSPGSL